MMILRRYVCSIPGLLAIAAVVVLAACAVNPATGKRQISLIGEEQEIEIGKESDKGILQSLGRYEDPELEAYVQQLGSRLAAVSERSHLEWKFRVVDDPVVNAFALPGGYIYITRGILAHFNSEAELAGVIGHEIGHVTARHGVNQMSKAQLANLGLGVGMIFSPRVQDFGQLAQTGLGLMFLKFGRDDELQADELGLRYVTRTDYDPRPMAEVFDTLRDVSQSTGGGRVPAWMSTHPAPENRKERILAGIGEGAGGTVERDGYLARIDGIVFGENPRHGYFKDHRFLHPDMKFRLDFPEDWKTSNRRTSVSASSPDGDAQVSVTLASQGSPEEAARAFLEQDGVTAGNSWVDRVHGIATVSRGFEFKSESQSLRGVAAFLRHDGSVFRLLGMAAGEEWSKREPDVLKSLASFRELTDPAALAVEPKKLRVVNLREAMSLEAFAERYDSSVPVETLALINHVGVGDRLPAGRKAKVVAGGKIP